MTIYLGVPPSEDNLAMDKGFADSGFALPIATFAKCDNKIILAKKIHSWRKLFAKKNRIESPPPAKNNFNTQAVGKQYFNSIKSNLFSLVLSMSKQLIIR